MEERGKKLGIYVAEFLTTIPKWGTPHAALFLVEEDADGPLSMMELHYDVGLIEAEDGQGEACAVMVPNIKWDIRELSQNPEISVSPLIGGYEIDVLPMWIHVMEDAYRRRERLSCFDYKNVCAYEAHNCRSGVASALKALGMEVTQDLFADRAGLGADMQVLSELFDYHAFAPSLDVLRAQWMTLAGELTLPKEVESAPVHIPA